MLDYSVNISVILRPFEVEIVVVEVHFSDILEVNRICKETQQKSVSYIKGVKVATLFVHCLKIAASLLYTSPMC